MPPINYSNLCVSGISLADLTDINGLMMQLSSNPRYIGYRELQRVLPGGYISVARDSGTLTPEKPFGKMVGMATLLLQEKLSGPFGIIEDVVVDMAYRGLGIGEELTKRLIAMARTSKLAHIDLTSSPDRIAANELYKKLGFELRTTNVYRLKL